MSDKVDHEELLRQHREKFSAHKAWIQQQAAALSGVGSHSMHTGYNSQGGHSGTTLTGGGATASGSGIQQQQHQHQRLASPEFSPPNNNGYEDPLNSYRSPRVSHNSQSALNVHTRATQWAKRREQKLDEMRMEHESDKLADCSFHPSVQRSNSINSARQSSAAIAGYEDFMKRQKLAREIADQKTLKVKCDGSKWKNETTVPEEFQLGIRRAPLKVLRAPSKVSYPDWDDVPNPNRFSEEPKIAKGAFSARTSSAIIDAAVLRR